MKKIPNYFLCVLLIICTMFSFTTVDYQRVVDDANNSVNVGDCSTGDHIDADNDDFCDLCCSYVVVFVDFYALNDLHGKFCDTSGQPGVDELASYLTKMKEENANTVLLASGDMWQGSAESNLTHGLILTEWMNEIGFDSMTLGNHDFDWGEDAIKENAAVAEFPFLAINIYDVKTGNLADYCTPSIMIERGGVKIGIIGAIGDCYSSISSNKVENVRFKVGNELTNLVKAEATRLRNEGADFIVYSLHDGYDSSSNGNKNISASELGKYYSPYLSNGYVDLVFEGHSHQNYTLIDTYGVYHMQGSGENKGISHVEIAINSANGNNRVTEADYVGSSMYSKLEDHEGTERIEDKYSETIDNAYSVIGQASRYYDDFEFEDIVAELYLEAGLEKWGDDYDIVFGGGFLRTRSPYNLNKGDITYAGLLSLLPFDNEIVLCSISGSKLKSRFVDSTSDDYHMAYSDFGEDLMGSISNNATYYVVVDIYTALYAYNGLTVVEYLDYTTYARDLVAAAAKDGRF